MKIEKKKSESECYKEQTLIITKKEPKLSTNQNQYGRKLVETKAKPIHIKKKQTNRVKQTKNPTALESSLNLFHPLSLTHTQEREGVLASR